ncbi:gasdermin-A-like [Gracilinanus agilis]|uniref:gasdermin-A-like n=1 Tax=Gracilinanus agilis TaxID=191870 RepID=UPI001CFDCF59|nr:gasdermin-A-like [Gracilinanus agilis]
MPSMFKKMSTSLVKEVGKKNLKPVSNLSCSQRFRPFCLLRKTSKKHKFWSTKFTCTEFSLMDILEPHFPVPEVTSSKPFHFYETEHGELKGEMDLDVASEMQGKVTGATTSCNNLALKLQILTVVPQIWEALMERKVKSKHSFLQEVQNRGEKLYVVTEAIENMEDTILMHSNKKEGSIETSLGQLSSLPVITFKNQAQGQTDRKKAVTINQGCILAYRALELFIENDGWKVSYIPEIKPRCDVEEFWMDELTGKFISAPRNFEEFQEMMIREQEALSKASRELHVTLLHEVQDILGNRKALQDLDDMLDQVPDMREKGQLEGPGVCILKHLQDHSGDASNQQAESILYFLGALMILTDTQQQLLAQSLEKRILPQQLELVKSILKTNFMKYGESSFSVHPELLSELKDEDQAITMNLMKECGLNLQCAGSQTKWNSEAKDSLSALYVVISFLQLLTQT